MVAPVLQKKINHVALVVDESGSINDRGLTRAIIDAVDGQVSWLSKLSTDSGQETRVSIYTFSGITIKCLMFDTDVLRLPSMRDHYHPMGGTPMISGTLKAIEDLEKTAQLYGDHGFLLFVLTDGEENNSLSTIPQGSGATLTRRLAALPSNWTVGCLVPDFRCKIRAQSFGFQEGNIAIWDATNVGGVSDVGEDIKRATSAYFTTRAAGGIVGGNLFRGVVASNVTQEQVKATGLKPIPSDKFMIVPVALASTSTLQFVIPKKSITRRTPDGVKHVEIQPFIEETGRRYVTGTAYYELVKSEKFDYHKGVVLIHRQTKELFRGEECKTLIGLTGTSTRIKPQPVRGGDYDIFVQSTSNNRHLPIGSRVLLFH